MPLAVRIAPPLYAGREFRQYCSLTSRGFFKAIILTNVVRVFSSTTEASKVHTDDNQVDRIGGRGARYKPSMKPRQYWWRDCQEYQERAKAISHS